MTDSSDNKLGIKLLEQRVASIENNMSSKSDIAVVSSKVDELKDSFSSVDRLADKVGDMVTQIAKKEETDKHLIKELEKQSVDIESLKKENQTFKEYVAADKPYKDIRGWIVKGVVTFIVGGILAAVFVVTK